MPKRKEPELTPAEQYKRFKEAAKKAGVSEKEEEFERAFKRVAHQDQKDRKRKSDRHGHSRQQANINCADARTLEPVSQVWVSDVEAVS